MTKCPRCGYEFRPAELYIMTESERLVVETLQDLRSSPFEPVSTRLIADTIGYSSRWVRGHLTNLRRHGVVCLPRGRCSGWVEVYAKDFQDHVFEHMRQQIGVAA